MQLHLHCKHEMLSKASLAMITFQLVQLIATSAKVTSIGQSVLNGDINLLFSDAKGKLFVKMHRL